MKRILLLLLCFSAFCFETVAQNVMPLPNHSNVYSGSARGFWFVAPTDFLITGLRVPSQAGSGLQYIQVVKLNDPMPIAFTAQSGNFTTLHYVNGATNGTVVPVSILINSGDTIGILGTAGTSNSYGNGAFTSNIFGNPVSIQRFGFQGNINTGATSLVWGVGYAGGGSISRVEVYYEPANVSNYPYCQNFEDGDGDWFSGGILDSWEYGEPNGTTISSASSGDNAWATNLDGSHNNDELSWVQSPEFDLTGLVDPAVRFMTNRNLENGDDGVSMQVSNDSGTVWSTLGTTSSPAPWYNNGSISIMSFFGSTHGWTGNSSGWTPMQHSIAPYAGDTSFFFRFVLGADGTTANEGFAFDDFIVAESKDVALVELDFPDSACGASETVVTGVICNNSVVPQSGFSITVDTNGTASTSTYSGTLGVCECDTLEFLNFNSANGGLWDLEVYTSLTGDVNLANDTIGGSMLLYPIPSGTVSGGGTFCPGEVASITFTFTGTGPWDFSFTDGTTGSFVPGSGSTYVHQTIAPGVYTIINLEDSAGCAADSGSISGSAEVIYSTGPIIDLGPDTTLCGTYTLEPGAGYASYAWQDGSSGPVYPASQSGTYAVTVTDNDGCTATDEVELTLFPLPVIDMDDAYLCEGGTHLFNAGGPFLSYLWQDGSTGQQFQASSAVTVSVTVTDFNGCEGTGSASILGVVPNPTPNLGPNYSGPAPAVLDAGAGYAAYFWNTGATTQTISVFASATYQVDVTDTFGCQGSDEIKVDIWPNSVTEISDQGMNVYPNPFNEMISLESETAIQSVRLEDALGKLIFEEDGINKERYTINDLKDLAPGIYFLSVDDGVEIKSLRLVKQ